MTSLIAERRLIVPGILEKVPELCEFVVEAATLAGLDEREVYHCELAVDEWCTNVIEHGLDQLERRGRLEVVCSHRGPQFIITVDDDGPPFDPTTLPEVDTESPLESRAPGGLGWLMIRKLMDAVQYQFKDGRNYLSMVKNGAQDLPVTNLGSPFVAEPVDTATCVLHLSGRLDSANSRQLDATLHEQIKANYVNLVLDLANVTYISSSGLKSMVTCWRQLQKRDGKIILVGLSARVFEIFEISGFDTLFPVAPTIAEALLALVRP